jgi:Tfp pilus assembly protein PilW
MMVMACIGSLLLFTVRSFIALGNYNDLDQSSRTALDTMSRDIRQTRALMSFDTKELVFIDQDSNTLKYAWDPTARTLKKTTIKPTGTEIKVLLTQCDYLQFGTSQRSPALNFTFVPNNTLAEAKLVDVSWTCSRQIMSQKVNTESVQTAKIVMRN